MNTPFTGGSAPGWPQEEFDYDSYKAKEDAKRIQRRLQAHRLKQLTKPEMSQDKPEIKTIADYVADQKPEEVTQDHITEAIIQKGRDIIALHKHTREQEEAAGTRQGFVSSQPPDMSDRGTEPNSAQTELDRLKQRELLTRYNITCFGTQLYLHTSAMPESQANRQRVTDIVRLQYDLSFKLAGQDWLENLDRVDTSSAMRVEAGELMESAGYKSWWTKGEQPIDRENCVMEIVDIFHFLIQGLLQAHYTRVVLTEPYIHDPTILTRNEAISQKMLIEPVADFIIEGLRIDDQLAAAAVKWSLVKAANKWLGKLLLDGPRASMPHFWVMCAVYGVDVPTLLTLYHAKNALNRFRKDNNYKGDMEGKPPYRKIWSDGREDNAHVMEVARQMASGGRSSTTADSMYAVIQALYDNDAKRASTLQSA